MEAVQEECPYGQQPLEVLPRMALLSPIEHGLSDCIAKQMVNNALVDLA